MKYLVLLLCLAGCADTTAPATYPNGCTVDGYLAVAGSQTLVHVHASVGSPTDCERIARDNPTWTVTPRVH